NKEIAREFGEAIGEEGLWGNNSNNFAALYAPAVNTHRSPFGGRNFEYYSEDGYIGGAMSAAVCVGALEKGVITYVKHFGINDQETNRCGALTWANEQSMREIYFKPFELSVKAGSLGIMTSLNRIGGVQAGANYNLLTEVLRNEWGFRGCVVTDSFGAGAFDANQMVRGGGDLCLGGGGASGATDATNVSVLRAAAKNVCYSIANSMAMNTVGGGSYTAPALDLIEYTGDSLAAALYSPYAVNLATAVFKGGEGYPADNNLIEYSLKTGRLPAGLSFEGGAGVCRVSGIPTEDAGGLQFTVQAKYLSIVKEAVFTLSATIDGSIIYNPVTLPDAVRGTGYSFDAGTASIFTLDEDIPDESLPPIVYTLAGGSALPEGLILTGDGVIEGVPVKECRNYEFTVAASAAGFAGAEATFSITVLNTTAFAGKALAAGKFGVPYLDKLTAAANSGGRAVRYGLKEENRLPKGLSLTGAGYVTGVPDEVVTDFVFIVVATADYSSPAEAQFVITIGIGFNAFALSDGQVGEEYDASVDQAQGAAGVSYSLAAGSVLPEGLTLDGGGGITGTPTKAGVYTVTVEAAKAGVLGDAVTLTLYIADADGGANSAGGAGGNIGVKGGLMGAGVSAAVMAVAAGAAWIVFRKRKPKVVKQ
ncbi:MAG: putative Ig domain-containing protein, partial [Clostridiales bacterium]|nr:putative Ig domain-containing protein [Clostridiales bacterium]